MNWLLILVAILILVFAIRGGYKGLLRLLFSLVAVFVLIGLMFYATPHISTFVKEKTPIYTMVETKASDAVQSRLEAGLEGSVGDATSGLPDKVSSYIISGAENTIEEAGVYDAIGGKVADWLLAGASFLIALVIALIIVKVIGKALIKFNKIPVLGKINRFLGFVAGIIEGVVVVYLLFMLVALIADSQLGKSCIECIDESRILSTLYYKNALLNFFRIG